MRATTTASWLMKCKSIAVIREVIQTHEYPTNQLKVLLKLKDFHILCFSFLNPKRRFLKR
jgi:hypothetical protein